MSSRSLAAAVLRRVWEEDAFAAAALSFALDRSSLKGADRGLATELVYGVLRTQPYIERRLSAFGRLKLSDHVLLSHLLVAAYQIEFLERVPTRAAVHEAVSLIRQERDERIAGFSNAILRALAEKGVAERMSLDEAILQSTPSWLRKRLIRDVGEQAARALLTPEVVPRSYLRVHPERPLPAWVKEECTRVSDLRYTYRFDAGGDVRAKPEYGRGDFVVQDLGAQLIAHALGAEAGERVLDVCAGRGQKSTLLVCERGAQVVATDLYEHKISILKEEAEKQGVELSTRVWDWTQRPPAEFEAAFDRILVDAPCSGVGTLRRRPEIARRLTASDPARLAALQLQIVKNAAEALKPNGVLLFATCSVLREEGEQVVDSICRETGLVSYHEPTCVDELLRAGGAKVESEGSALRLLPHVHGTDGYFIARLKRISGDEKRF